MEFNNNTLREAIKLYFKNKEECIRIHSPVSEWDVSEVTDMSNLFAWETNYYDRVIKTFNENISHWDVSKVKNMKNMFHLVSDFNQPLNNWDVSNVTNMKGMFCDTKSFNQPLNNWDVSKLKNMEYMFYMAKKFDQSLSSWELKNNVDISYMFDGSKMEIGIFPKKMSVSFNLYDSKGNKKYINPFLINMI